MRYLFGFLGAFALNLMLSLGCGEGGEGGDPFPGNCGNQGQGGGAAEVLPGLYRAGWDDESATYDACVYVNENCTELEASTECNIGEDDSQAHFLEIQWTDGRNENGEECAAGVGVTTDLVTIVPINADIDPPGARFGFQIEFSDAEGGDWEIFGAWSYTNLHVSARRITGDVVCRPQIDYPNSICPLTYSSDMCLAPESWL
jgi:hypothetical protein